MQGPQFLLELALVEWDTVDMTTTEVCGRHAIDSDDLNSFAILFVGNADVPARLRRGGPFNPAERKTFYGGSAGGYTDYPAL